MAVRMLPITDADAARVGAFLHAHLNPRVSAHAWARSIEVPWAVDRPNAGFMLLDEDDAVVGAHLAFYSEREIAGRLERFCNLGAWCVLPEHRFSGLRLLKALLAQEGYTFTDLSPSGSVVGVNRRLRFQTLDTAAALVPNLPWPGRPGRVRAITDPAAIERVLGGRDLQVFRDHAHAAAARHVVLSRGDEHCYVIFRRDRRRGVPLFASVLHVSDASLFRELAGPFARHLLLRHGLPFRLLEERVAGRPPRLSRRVPPTRQKMFLSAHLEAAQIDYLYSELVCVAW